METEAWGAVVGQSVGNRQMASQSRVSGRFLSPGSFSSAHLLTEGRSYFRAVGSGRPVLHSSSLHRLFPTHQPLFTSGV